MKNLIGKFCRVYVKNLSGKTIKEDEYGNEKVVADKPIIYSAEVKDLEQVGETTFLKVVDRTGSVVRINVHDIIQIVEVDD